MYINKNIFKIIKKFVIVVSSAALFTGSINSYDDYEQIKIENDNYLTNNLDNDNNEYDIVHNLNISQEDYLFFSNINNYKNKSYDEIAVMLSRNKNFSQLNEILFIAPLSNEDFNKRKYDNVAIARYFCRDFMSETFYNTILKSITIADSIDWKNSNNSKKVLNISNQIYDAMNNYIAAWNEKNAEKTIQFGLTIEHCILNFQPIDFYIEKIEPKLDKNSVIYIGNNSDDSEILLSDDSLIKQYYDILQEDSGNIPSWSLSIPSLKFYFENYFMFLMEEYDIQVKQGKLYATIINEKNIEKTLS